MKWRFVLAAIGTGVFLYMYDKSKPRGIRNNNPLNIRENQHVDFDWEGEHLFDLDNEFEEFTTPEKGIRAGARILKNYRNNYGLNTVTGIINRWAPPVENDTQSYIESVAGKIGVDTNQVLTDESYPALIAAMIFHENGQQPYALDVINDGFNQGFYS